jgi:hypothetical protein
MTTRLNYIGIVDEMQTWEVINEITGEVIGYNQTAPDNETQPN